MTHPLDHHLRSADGKSVRLFTTAGVYDGILGLHSPKGQVSLGIDQVSLDSYSTPGNVALHGYLLTLDADAVMGIEKLLDPLTGPDGDHFR